MGYQHICAFCIVQVGLACAYIHHRSSISHIYYQYQKAQQRYHELIQERNELAQKIQTDHTYNRILKTAERNGMRPIVFQQIRRPQQGAS